MRPRISFLNPWRGLACVLLSGFAFSASAAAKPAPGVEILETPRILTLGIDARDYDAVVDRLVADLLTRPELKTVRGKVLGLGPIDDNDCPFRFNVVTFQEQLATKLHRSQQVGFSEVINTLKAESATAARTEIKYFDFERENTDDKELFAVVGELAKVDFLLFGRLSCEIATAGAQTEVTYRFNWRVMDLQRGTWAWVQQVVLPKARTSRDEPEPQWLRNPRGDSAVFYYCLGRAERAPTSAEARGQAIADGKTQLLQRLNAQLTAGGDPVMKPVAADEIDPEPVAQAEFEKREKGGISTSLLLRLAKKKGEKILAAREAGRTAWVDAERAFEKARALSAGDERRQSLKACVARYAELAVKFPGVDLGRVLLRQAEAEQARGFPCAARAALQSISAQPGAGAWQAKAAEMKEKLVCDETAEALRRKLEGRTVAVIGVLRLAGKVETWQKLEEKLGGNLSGYGASVQRPLVDPNAAFEWSSLPTALTLPPELRKYDLVWLVCADGDMVATPDNGMDYHRFHGKLHAVAVEGDKRTVAFDDEGDFGRRLPDRLLNLESFATGVTKVCVEKYLETIGRPATN